MQCKIIRCHSTILKLVAAITVLAGSSVAIADDRPTNRKSARQDSPFAKWDKNSDGFLTRKDLIYAVVGDRKLPLDLYIPEKSKQALPLVIWIHGGGWRSGSKANPRKALSLLKHGYAVASVEYRLSGEAIFPAAIEDCKAAVSFLRLNAAKYNLDPNRFGAWGSSAGGHLVALLGTTNDVSDFNTHDVCKQASPAVQAVCNWFGPTDFLRMNDFKSRIDHDSPSSPESKFIGGSIQKNKQQVARANPITYVSKSDPPMLIMHGDVDQLVPFNQSELLIAALRKQKVESTLYKVKRGDHGFGGAVDKPEKLFKLVVNFFDKQLK
jgi:acetyl esterase/lipase